VRKTIEQAVKEKCKRHVTKSHLVDALLKHAFPDMDKIIEELNKTKN
jgi:hypothetical protein